MHVYPELSCGTKDENGLRYAAMQDGQCTFTQCCTCPPQISAQTTKCPCTTTQPTSAILAGYSLSLPWSRRLTCSLHTGEYTLMPSNMLPGVNPFSSKMLSLIPLDAASVQKVLSGVFLLLHNLTFQPCVGEPIETTGHMKANMKP